MADTKRTLSALQTLLANNTAGNIGAQKIRDFLISCVLTDSGSGSDQIQIKPHTGDSTTFFQILDFDGGTPILNVDSVNERVGIGRNDPATELDISGFNTTITIHTTSASSGDAQIKFTNGLGASLGSRIYHDTNTHDLIIETNWDSNEGDIVFNVRAETTPLEVMRLKGTGNVVIGHTSGAGLFNTVKSADDNNTYLDTYSTNVGHTAYIINRKSASATKGTVTETGNTELFGLTWYKGVNSSGAFARGVQIKVQQDGASGATYIPTNYIMETYSATAVNANQLVLHNDGNIGILTDAPLAALDINGDSIRIRTSQSPVSGGTGVQGEIAWDASYIYVCTATNTWKRAGLTGGY